MKIIGAKIYFFKTNAKPYGEYIKNYDKITQKKCPT
jgi:uncharacterized pyridoxamine 5'-phosphate oxidase family protein